MKKNILFLTISLLLMFYFPSCQMFEPEDDNHRTSGSLLEDPEFAEGLLMRAYALIPTNNYSFDDVATDDAVTNDKFSSYLRIATGEWSSTYNPQDEWTNGNRAITSINQFLSIVEDVPFKWTDQELNDLYVRRLTGESYALRGLFKYFILRNHGGFSEGNELLGAQIFESYPLSNDDFITPRAALTAYMNSAYADLEKSLEYLPMDYGDIKNLNEAPGFSGISNVDKYNTVFGDYMQQRMSGRHAKAIAARLSLLAASPYFNTGNDDAAWVKAANLHGELLNDIGGISGIDSKGNIFYLKAQVDDAKLNSGDKKDLKEMMWRRPIYNNRSREVNNFPPSLYGNGNINPSQNLVDAFPMKNGYPISDANSAYDPLSPYKNRDPRLDLYIVYDGSKMKGAVIKTGVGGGVNAVDSMSNSTRTGYYMRKLLREEVNADPTKSGDQEHFETHIRYTELFLNYAEAANEAWGATNSGGFGFSAKDVIGAIRKRAGITQPDAYLNSISDKETMRKLIKNERRLELCFEGFRFWDLRRWKEDLTEPVKGVSISLDGEYSYFEVEKRNYNNDYMHYGPIPNNEVVRFNIQQNKGW